MVPYVLCRAVYAFEKRKHPDVHGALLDRYKGKSDAQKRKCAGKRPRDDKRKRQFVRDKREYCPGAQIPELFNCHVTDQSELERGDILRNRMLLHTYIIVEGKIIGFNSTKRIRTVKTPLFEFSRKKK